ncbi:divisome protein SepX/GlpR, partial [Streptomyces sp. IBSBF 2435]
MSSSGLIYAVIVGAWAAYLVPMWLRRQDELNEARPTERFSTAIRLLSGRAAMERRVAKARGESAEPGDDDVEDDLDPADVVDVRGLAVPATEVRPAAGRDRTTASGPARPDPRAKVLARRRRTTTMLFLAFTVGAVAAAVGGVALLWVPAVPAALLTVYIGQMRRQERRRYEVRLDQRHAAEAARRLRARPDRGRPERVRAELPAPPVQEAPPVPAAPAPSPRTADRRALVEQTDHAEWVDQQRAQQSADDGWDPVPVPLPTYVTAPVAPRTTGGVDLGAPDTWSSARSGTTPTPE